ncbi:tyrosinase family protein [Streptomyces sp. NPDC058045]|uniref:tyrosinase family protein n=1 Tax=Streptomyces sp. NPDC058045 TaxID=3346311 RepID=UPI0036E26DE2
MVYVRKNVKALSGSERKRFVDAVLRLKRSGRYDEFVRTHMEFYTADGDRGLRVAHMTPSFLPWHRLFLLDFERALRAVDSSVTVPYWDWTAERSASAVPWSKDLLGGNGRAGDRRVTTGPFAHATGNWTLRHNVTDERYLVRDFGHPPEGLTLPTAAELAVAERESGYDVEPWDSTSASGFRNNLEGWRTRQGQARWRNHNKVHRWVGGTMLGGASVNDPVFWLHHSFVDLVWSRWQRKHPDARYLPARPPLPGTRQYRRIVGRDQPMPPFDLPPSEAEDHRRVYRYA